MRFYSRLLVFLLLLGTAGSLPGSITLETSATQGVHFLSWDLAGGSRHKENLLRPGELVQALNGKDFDTPVPLVTADSTSSSAPGWSFEKQANDELRIHIRAEAGTPLQLRFPFTARVTPTTFIAAATAADGTMSLPGILAAPDFGYMTMTASTPDVTAKLVGNRETGHVDFLLQCASPPAEPIEITLAPLEIPPPDGVPADDPFWKLARHSWLHVIQPTSQWGDPAGRYGAPAGVLGNNVVSDPASTAMWTFADAAFLQPTPAPGINLMEHVRTTLDWWLDHKTSTTGEAIAYWDYYNSLDSNPSLLISAWDYVESTGDMAWLNRRIALLEKMSAFLESRNTDADGLVEATQSGNRGTLHEPHRSSCWWDAINTGHKDGFSNALIYRAWRCLADLETKLDRTDQAAKYHALADRLKADYYPALYNEKTGWLGWWRSADGELHDYASPVLNALAIEYGLVPADKAKDILARLRRKADQAGFARYDLGIPSFLVPVNRSDYLQPNGLGCPQREDGTDTFGWYMNGGITAGHSLHWIVAHHQHGEGAYADAFLRKMLKHGPFQSGVTNAPMKGIDWTDWNGNPTGYEGYLSDNYRFLQAVALRHPAVRKRMYRPLEPSTNGHKTPKPTSPAGT